MSAIGKYTDYDPTMYSRKIAPGSAVGLVVSREIPPKLTTPIPRKINTHNINMYVDFKRKYYKEI